MAYYSSPNVRFSHKPIGAYLVEAGLLSEAQVGVALVDQQNIASMSFGEILVTRGWVKEKTIEYLMKKVIIPERIAEKSSFSDLESNLIRQKPRSTYIPGAEHDSAQNLQRIVSKETLTQKKEEGVNWLG